MNKRLSDRGPNLSKVAAVIRPATRPKDKRLELLVGASLPQNSGVTKAMLDRLQTKYSGRLKIKLITADRRICIILPCKTAKSLAEAGIRADVLRQNIVRITRINPLDMRCGYNLVREKLDEPSHLAA